MLFQGPLSVTCVLKNSSTKSTYQKIIQRMSFMVHRTHERYTFSGPAGLSAVVDPTSEPARPAVVASARRKAPIARDDRRVWRARAGADRVHRPADHHGRSSVG